MTTVHLTCLDISRKPPAELNACSPQREAEAPAANCPYILVRRLNLFRSRSREAMRTCREPHTPVALFAGLRPFKRPGVWWRQKTYEGQSLPH